MNKKLKRFLPLILILVMVMGSIASVSAAGLAFYDGTTKTSYSPDMTDEELDELIAAIEAGNNVSKLVGDKLVNYKDYKDAITAVILEAIENEEDITAAVLAKMNDIVAGLEEQEGPGEEPGELEVIEISAINANATLAGATVKPNEQFNVAFNQALDEKTITNENITLKKGGLAVPVNLVLSEDKKSVRVVPTQPLEVKTTFSLVVTTAVKTATGEALAADSTTSFNTADAVVVTSFKVNNKTLEQGTLDATDLAAGITLVANKDLDRNTVNTSTVKLYNKTDSKYVPLNVVGYTSASKTITITPLASAVENNKAYELRLDGVKALDGSDADGYVQGFSLGVKVAVTLSVPKDYANGTTKVNPALTGSVVKIGATNNANADADYTLDAFRVTVNFNGRAINTDTLKPGTIKLLETDENGVDKAGTEVAGTINYDATTFSATFVPNVALKEDTNYKVSTTKAIKDIIGLEVNEEYITFKTGDFTPPTVVSSNVDTGKRLGAVDPLKVTFSEKMTPVRLAPVAANPAPAYTASASVMVLDKDGASVAATATLDPADTTGKTYNIIPSANWTINETYTVKINGKNYNKYLSAADEAGNQLANEYTVTFTTADTAIPAVTSVKAYEIGYTGAKPNKELLGSTATNPVTGITESGTVAQESIYIQFNRVVDGGFLSNANYELSTDGGKNFVTLPGTWTPTAKADDNGKNTIIQLLPNANTVVNGEARYVLRLKKDTATTDNKKLVDNVVVYYSTEVAKPAVQSVKVFTEASDGAGTQAVVDFTNATTKALELNNGIELAFNEQLLVSPISNTSIKFEDITDAANPVALIGAFYQKITQTGTGNAAADFTKDIFADTSAGAKAPNNEIYWAPSSDDNKFKAGHSYKLTIDGVKDAVGNPMAAPYIKYFTVADTAAPTITSTSVTNGQQNVSVDPVFTITFSKPVANADTTGQITLGAVPIKVTMSTDKKTATVKPLVYLDKLTQYTLTIAGTIVDGAGTAIAIDTNIVFTTENVEVKAEMTSAVWKSTATEKSLTLTFNQPVKPGTVVDTDVVINGAALSGTTTDIAISQDRKTIVLTEATGQTFTVIPGVHAISLAKNGSIAPAAGEYKQSVTVSTLAAATGTVTYGTPENAAAAVAATGTITYGTPTDDDTVTVDGTTFKKAAAGSATEFSTIAELTALIEALANVNAANDGTTITVTAANAGVAGNAITLSSAGTGGALAVSGANLASGADAVAATTVTVDGTTFTKAAAGSATEFSTIAELVALIDALPSVSAADSTPSGTITITAATQGAAGNNITLAKGGDGTTAVSGAKLTGGADATTQTPANSITIQ